MAQVTDKVAAKYPATKYPPLGAMINSRLHFARQDLIKKGGQSSDASETCFEHLLDAEHVYVYDMTVHSQDGEKINAFSARIAIEPDLETYQTKYHHWGERTQSYELNGDKHQLSIQHAFAPHSYACQQQLPKLGGGSHRFFQACAPSDEIKTSSIAVQRPT